MHYTTGFRIALKALGRHKMRTFLTMLGMIIGVGAVMTMVALGKRRSGICRIRREVGGHEPRLRKRRQLHAGRRRAARGSRTGCCKDAYIGRCCGDFARRERRHASRARVVGSRTNAGRRQKVFRSRDRDLTLRSRRCTRGGSVRGRCLPTTTSAMARRWR